VELGSCHLVIWSHIKDGVSDIPSPLPVPQKGSTGRSLVKDYLAFSYPSPSGWMVQTGRQLCLHLFKSSSRLLIADRPFAGAHFFASLCYFVLWSFCRLKRKGKKMKLL